MRLIKVVSQTQWKPRPELDIDEVPSQSWRSSYWRFKSNVNLEELSLSGFKRMVPSCYELTNVKKNRSIIAQCTTRPVHRRT